ncbi:MAG: response regulator [Thermodesulfobacteriota bacterium]
MAPCKTLLVVDDEKLPRTLLCVNLKEAGYQVLEAEDGRAALSLLREQAIDVVLLDLVMPEMDGFQVLRKMKADNELKDIPVVVVSASDDMNSVVKCLEMGAVDHLSKPFDPALLQVRIRSALAISQVEEMRASGEAPKRSIPGPGRHWGMEAAADKKTEPGMKISGFLKALLGWSRPYRNQMRVFLLLILACLGVEAALPLGFKFITDDALIPHNFRVLMLTLGILVFAMVAAALMQVVTDWLYARLAVKILNDLRFSMYRHLQSLSMSFFGRISAGEITSRFTTDLAAVENTVMLCLPLAISQLMMVLFTLGLLFALEWKLAMFVIFGIFVSYRAEQRIEKPAAQADVRMKREQARITAILQDVIGMQQAIKAFRLKNMVAERFKLQMVNFFHLTMRACFLSYLTDRVPGRCAAIFGMLTIAGGSLLTFFGYLTIGGLVSFQVLLSGLVIAINELTWSIPYLVRATGGMQKIEQLLQEKPDITDAPDAVPLPRPGHEISFNNVSFGYTEGQVHLKNVTFSIPIKSSVNFIGPSGSGKSTVLNLLMRFYDPQEGTICIDGVDLRKVTLDSLRQHMSIVFQDTVLFNTTIRENIRVGKQGATDEEVEAAARAAGIHETITGFPGGYETIVGERGGKLSAGLRQQLAIARAILPDPAILLLDDVTSAQDTTTTSQIDRLLEQLGRDRTVISVTHRLEAAPRVRSVFVFNEGHLVEQGPHTELLRNGGTYAQLWQKQTPAGIYKKFETGHHAP